MLCSRERIESKETWIKGTNDGKRKIKRGEREKNGTDRAEPKFRTKQIYLSFAAEESQRRQRAASWKGDNNESKGQPQRPPPVKSVQHNFLSKVFWTLELALKMIVKRVLSPLPSMISPEFLQKPLWEKMFCYGENNSNTVKAETAQLEIHIVFRLHFRWFANH